MAIPLSRPSPAFTSLSESHTSLPRPCTPTSAVMMTMETAIIIVWLMPIIIEFLANGNCTWNSV